SFSYYLTSTTYLATSYKITNDGKPMAINPEIVKPWETYYVVGSGAYRSGTYGIEVRDVRAPGEVGEYLYRIQSGSASSSSKNIGTRSLHEMDISPKRGTYIDEVVAEDGTYPV